MDPLDAFPPIPSGALHQGPTARVERADADRQRERTRDDQHAEPDDEQSFEGELGDASKHGGGAQPTLDRRAPPPEPHDDRDEDDPGQHIDISV